MKKFLRIYRYIVGGECGFAGEGNEQWYYFLSLVINLMLIWWLAPEIGLVFTILAVIHYVTVSIYGYFDLYCSIGLAYAYLGMNLALLAVAIFTNLKWAAITTAITTIAFFSAPDCTANNIFLRKSYSKFALVFNTIILTAFVIIVVLLPARFWLKTLLIVSVLFLHPIIDILEEDCITISEVTYGVFNTIKSSIKKPEKH